VKNLWKEGITGAGGERIFGVVSREAERGVDDVLTMLAGNCGRRVRE